VFQAFSFFLLLDKEQMQSAHHFINNSCISTIITIQCIVWGQLTAILLGRREEIRPGLLIDSMELVDMGQVAYAADLDREAEGIDFPVDYKGATGSLLQPFLGPFLFEGNSLSEEAVEEGGAKDRDNLEAEAEEWK
jgi:hypothetical protein